MILYAREFPRLFALFIASLSAVSLFAADLKTIKAPAGWNVSLFAAPPDVGYPTCLSTSPNGDLYVGIDENGSIDAKSDRGRVVRCTDTDGDGKADKFVTFASMDSPRGIWFDDNVLYVQHPPFVSAFTDDNGDGQADHSEVLVRGLGFDLKFRGADHTINGMRMGIDGFLYIACGDYGATNAVGRDGTRLQLHGGGVVRVRPDGTGLEIVSHGQRNIYDVAVSPEMDLFTRDNTNDGDGWDVRLSHVVMGGDYGYPTLYKKFGDEIIQPLADYGGGSPCGALFMDEPGFPNGFGRGLYTVEWGRSAIFRHPLTPKGASFQAGQEKFIDVSRPTDFDVDGSGRLYLSSWHGATFTYNGPNAGFVVRVTPPGWTFKPFPELKKATTEQLLRQVESRSAFARLSAQREILRRAVNPQTASRLEAMAASAGATPARVAAIFTLRQLLGNLSHPALLRLAEKDDIREFALRALADDTREASAVPTAPFVAALKDQNPRVRLQAVTALGRLGAFNLQSSAKPTKDWQEIAANLLPLTSDADPTVAHVAVKGLVQLRAADACLAAFDSAGTLGLQPGAARALQAMHQPSVVDGLITRLAKLADPASRRLLMSALARLYNREDDWNGRWWGTRPDSTGPYFKPVTWSGSDRIADVFKKELARASGDNLTWLVVTLQKNRVDLPELTKTVLELAERDPQFRPVVVDLFSGRAAMPDEAVPLFTAIATADQESPALRAKALRALLRSGKNSAAADGAFAAAVAIASGKSQSDLNSAWEDYVRDARHAQRVARFQGLAETGSPAERIVAYGVLTSLATGRLAPREAKAAADSAIEHAWSKTDMAVPLLRALGRLRNDAYALQVRGLVNDARPEIASAAKLAAGQMGLNNKPDVGVQGLIESLKFEEVVGIATKEKGEARRGREVFTKAGCVACHTTSVDDAPKGPFLGGIATRYTRAELCESILKPTAKIAQGFETQWFRIKDGEEVEGFVTREGGDDLDVRNILGITTTLAKKEIVERSKRESSMMPSGLVDKLTTADLASLLAFLESLKSN